MDLIAWIIVGIIVAALVGLVTMASRRKWNSDGSDDERRRKGDP